MTIFSREVSLNEETNIPFIRFLNEIRGREDVIKATSDVESPSWVMRIGFLNKL